jgi:flavin-dependent dehydrogenase
MPLLLFPGGYGGMVSLDEGKASLSCCVRRDTLRAIRERRRGMAAGDALFAHILDTCRGVRDALGCAWQVSPWLSAGPIRPGVRCLHEHGVFRAGNSAGEAHPLVAEGISMAIQSAQLLAGILLAAQGLDAARLEEAGRRYAAAWHANFALRVRASSAFAALLVMPGTRGAGIRLLRTVPAALTLGARWSGKARRLSMPAAA